MTAQSDTPPLWHLPLNHFQPLLESACEANPQTHRWGYFVRHHGFTCGPVSMGMFMWFSSQAEMLQGLVQGEAQLEFEGDIPVNLISGLLHLQQTADQLMSGQISVTQACQAMSQALDFLSVEWRGHFDDLLQAESDFASELPQAFWAKRHLESKAAIPATEQTAFIYFLQTWGH